LITWGLSRSIFRALPEQRVDLPQGTVCFTHRKVDAVLRGIHEAGKDGRVAARDGEQRGDQKSEENARRRGNDSGAHTRTPSPKGLEQRLRRNRLLGPGAAINPARRVRGIAYGDVHNITGM
jgi:hypothetical protein